MPDVQGWLESLEFTNTNQKPTIVKALLYGGPGVGKTHFAGTAPNPLFIDTDKGMNTILRMNKTIPYVTIERGEKVYPRIMDILKGLKEEKTIKDYTVKTLVIDSMSKLADFLLIEAMKFPANGRPAKVPNVDKPDWDDYNALQSRAKNIIGTAQDMGLHVIAICGEKLERDEIRGTFVGRPNIVGGYRETIAHDFDELYYMTTKNTQSGIEYLLYSVEYTYFKAKSRLGVAQKITDPSFSTVYKDIIEEEE